MVLQSLDMTRWEVMEFMGHMGGMARLFLVVGIFCYLYAIVILSYVGPQASYLLFWPVAGSGLIALSFLDYYGHRMDSVKILLFARGAMLISILIISLLMTIIALLLVDSASLPKEDSDYIIVLGAKVNGTTVSKALKERLDCTLSYAEEHENAKIIVSGGKGKGEDVTEAEAMSRYLQAKGIDPLRIIKEEQSTDTEENLRFSMKMIGDCSAKCVVVSNRFHIYRAVRIGRKMGMKHIEGLAAKTDPWMCVHYYLREAFAVIKYKMKGTI